MSSLAVLLSVALLGAESEGTVVVFPFGGADPRSEEAAARATRAAVRSLAGAEGIDVVGPAAARRQGVDLGAQARGCTFDVFCLVEVARLMSGDRALLAEVESNGEAGYLLGFRELDVARATLSETLRLEAPEEGLEAAAAAAARRLSTPPAASMRLALAPPSARVELYGERIEAGPGSEVRWWPGRWWYRVAASGYASESGWLELGSGASVELRVELRPDPLYVPEPTPPPGAEEPFGRPSRSSGSGVTPLEAGLERPRPAEPDRWARPVPWVVVGVGVAAGVTGSLLMIESRSRYADLSLEPRYVPGASAPADVARSERDGLRDRHLAGSLTVLGGVLSAVTGLAWLLFVEPEGETPSR